MATFSFAAVAQGVPQDSGRFSTFYLFATALSTGITLVLPFVSLRLIGRRFFVLMSFVAIVFFALAVAASGLETGYFHVACAGLLIVYNVFLPAQTGVDQSLRRESTQGGPQRFAQALSGAILGLAALCGTLGVVLDAIHHPQPIEISGRQELWLALSFVTGSLLLGSAATGMVLGHWYLVVRNASFRPLATLTWVLLTALGLRTLTALSTLILQEARWTQLLADGGVTGFLLGPGIFILARWGFGLLAPIVMTWLAWKCVQIKSNQSATGILYVVLAFVLIGEILAKYFLLSEGLVL